MDSPTPEQDPGRKVVRLVSRDGLGRDKTFWDRGEWDGRTVFTPGVHLDYDRPRNPPGPWTTWRQYADGTEDQVLPGESGRGPHGGW